MQLHGNARTCPASRRLLVDRIEVEAWSVADAAAVARVSERSAFKWLQRYRDEGPGRLVDRSSAPQTRPNRDVRRRPGELLHVDVKKLGRIGRPGHRVHGDRRARTRGIGWEYVHVGVDDRTRLAYTQRPRSALGHRTPASQLQPELT